MVPSGYSQVGEVGRFWESGTVVGTFRSVGLCIAMVARGYDRANLHAVGHWVWRRLGLTGVSHVVEHLDWAWRARDDPGVQML